MRHLKIFPSPQAQVQLTFVAVAISNDPEQRQSKLKPLTKNPDALIRYRAHLEIASSIMRKNQVDSIIEAFPAIQAALAISLAEESMKADAYFLKGLYYSQQLNITKAKLNIQKSIELDPCLIQPYKVFYVQLSDINTRQLALYLVIIETAYLVGLAAMVGQTSIEQKNFFLTIIQYTLVFSIFLTIELFQRPPEVTTLLPYENLFALLISLFCGLIFWGVFQKNGIMRRILAGFILIVPLYFVVI